MKKSKKEISNLVKLNVDQMQKINGGQWYSITDKNGNKTLYWH